MTGKLDVVRMAFNAGMTQEKKEIVDEGEVLISDTFTTRPAVTFKKFMHEDEKWEKQFPMGAYVTMWWFLVDDKLKNGGIVLFDAFHNPGYDMATKKQMRVNAAFEKAGEFLDDLRRVGNAH